MADKDLVDAICKTMEQHQMETRLALSRVHERLDQLFERESVTARDCEQRRNACKACTNQKIKDASGWPPWLFGVGSIGGLLIGSMMIYIITAGRFLP